MRLEYQINLFFCADRGSAKENSDKRLFWAPEGRKVEPPRAKNLRIAISHSFLTGLVFPFVETFLRVYYCLRLKEFKLVKFCFIDLNLGRFEPWGPLSNIFKEKMCWYGNINCLDIMPKHFLFPKPE